MKTKNDLKTVMPLLQMLQQGGDFTDLGQLSGIELQKLQQDKVRQEMQQTNPLQNELLRQQATSLQAKTAEMPQEMALRQREMELADWYRKQQVGLGRDELNAKIPMYTATANATDPMAELRQMNIEKLQVINDIMRKFQGGGQGGQASPQGAIRMPQAVLDAVGNLQQLDPRSTLRFGKE